MDSDRTPVNIATSQIADLRGSNPGTIPITDRIIFTTKAISSMANMLNMVVMDTTTHRLMAHRGNHIEENPTIRIAPKAGIAQTSGDHRSLNIINMACQVKT